MMASLLRIIFGLAVAGMIFAAFVWPLAIGTDTASPSLRLACLISFGAYLSAILGRLILRVRSRRDTKVAK